EARIGRVLWSQDLDRHLAVELLVDGPPERRHPAFAEWRGQPVSSADLPADHLHALTPSASGPTRDGSALPAVSVSQIESAHEGTHLIGIVRFQRHGDVRLQPADARSGIVPNAREMVTEDRLLVAQVTDRIGQLDLSAGPTLRGLQDVEDLGTQYVPAQDREV